VWGGRVTPRGGAPEGGAVCSSFGVDRNSRALMGEDASKRKRKRGRNTAAHKPHAGGAYTIGTYLQKLILRTVDNGHYNRRNAVRETVCKMPTFGNSCRTIAALVAGGACGWLGIFTHDVWDVKSPV